LQRILTRDLNKLPYKIQLIQQLLPRDRPARLEFANEFLVLAEEPDFHKKLISDEAHFHLSGFVNKQNCCIWASEQPSGVHQNFMINR
jgi:hypothetical protein